MGNRVEVGVAGCTKGYQGEHKGNGVNTRVTVLLL